MTIAPPEKIKGDCECGSDECTLWGTLKRPDRQGRRHVRGCTCPVCRGKNNRAKGDAKARRARQSLNIPGANSRHEEVWGGEVRVEVKAGAQIRPAITAFVKMREQSEAARPIGDIRPFVGVAMPDGTSDGVIMFRLSDLENVIAGLADQLGITRPD
jgi:hypothetical protein